MNKFNFSFIANNYFPDIQFSGNKLILKNINGLNISKDSANIHGIKLRFGVVNLNETVNNIDEIHIENVSDDQYETLLVILSLWNIKRSTGTFTFEVDFSCQQTNDYFLANPTLGKSYSFTIKLDYDKIDFADTGYEEEVFKLNELFGEISKEINNKDFSSKSPTQYLAELERYANADPSDIKNIALRLRWCAGPQAGSEIFMSEFSQVFAILPLEQTRLDCKNKIYNGEALSDKMKKNFFNHDQLKTQEDILETAELIELCAKSMKNPKANVGLLPTLEVYLNSASGTHQGNAAIVVNINEHNNFLQRTINRLKTARDNVPPPPSDDPALRQDAINEINTHWITNENPTTHQINGKHKEDVLGDDAIWQNGIKTETGVDITSQKNYYLDLINTEIKIFYETAWLTADNSTVVGADITTKAGKWDIEFFRMKGYTATNGKVIFQNGWRANTTELRKWTGTNDASTNDGRTYNINPLTTLKADALKKTQTPSGKNGISLGAKIGTAVVILLLGGLGYWLIIRKKKLEVKE